MGMTIDEAIGIITAKGNYSYTVIENEAKDVLLDTSRKYQMVRADYEKRLKADMVAMLTEIQLEIEEKQYDFMADKDYDEGIRFGLMLASQQLDKKINTLK